MDRVADRVAVGVSCGRWAGAGGAALAPALHAFVGGVVVLCAACLVGIYVAQEFLEGLFATGHPGGLAGIFGYGGWWSIPAALAVGLVLAAIFHGARWVLDEVAQRLGHSAGARGAQPASGSSRCAAAAALAAGGGLVGPRSSELSRRAEHRPLRVSVVVAGVAR